MSLEQLKTFLENVKSDAELQERLKAAVDSDAVISIAKEAGFLISADDLNNAQSEISDGELEGAAGGLGCGGPLRTRPDDRRVPSIGCHG